jgi:hypothetical protein
MPDDRTSVLEEEGKMAAGPSSFRDTSTPFLAARSPGLGMHSAGKSKTTEFSAEARMT